MTHRPALQPWLQSIVDDYEAEKKPPVPPAQNRADRRARAAGKNAIRPVWSKTKR